jgi:hypothetical protein
LGSNIVTFPGSVTFINGTPVLQTAPGSVDIFSFMFDGITFYGVKVAANGTSGTSGTSGPAGSSGTSGTSSSSIITTNRQTASYTLVLGDQDKLIEMNVASANNLTIPLNSSVAFPIGTQIMVTQYGTGATTLVATGGVTVNSLGAALKLNGRFSAASLIKIATDEWDAFGNLTI